ncbi:MULTISPECIES: glycosyltransferase family 2 protein [Methylomonas]|uniref:Glycosyltransferase 2-like domain-containing protein n=1 Tax=Methylomonas koyamae TaxID=702114 RepID=A0A291IIM1_9GAMM|nr:MULTISPECIES: glycosyltransferase [Methylomonas]ANE55253.1 hypothetical protein AYM39_08735 [Methylomonas sp. DH-1]ATG90056.1 hypothetical protein MKLM6_1820 [Methylomonas koyamae]OAI29231.1 hypothetical protein A1356_23240 [Methylomonas koyamae]
MLIQPIISICIPVYNGAKFLQETLDSISRQSYTNIEIIIVDDNSTDNSSIIINKFNSDIYKTIKHKNDSNIGLHANCEKCISLANGDWIKFVFQDDILDKKCIEELFNTAKKTDSQIICGNKSYLFFDNPPLRKIISYKHIELINKIFTNNFEKIPQTRVSDFFTKYLLGNFLGEPSCFLIKKTIIDKYGGFNPNLTQLLDYEFYARTTLNEGLAYSNKAYIYFRVHANSETYRNTKENLFRSRDIEYILMLLIIKNNAHYKNFLKFLDRIYLSSYINSLLVIRAKRAQCLAKKSNNKTKSIWNKAVGDHPEIIKYIKKPLVKNLILLTLCTLWINIRHALILIRFPDYPRLSATYE